MLALKVNQGNLLEDVRLYVKEAVAKRVEADGSGKQGFEPEKETVHDRYESRKTFGANHGVVNFPSGALGNAFMRLSWYCPKCMLQYH